MQREPFQGVNGQTTAPNEATGSAAKVLIKPCSTSVPARLDQQAAQAGYPQDTQAPLAAVQTYVSSVDHIPWTAAAAAIAAAGTAALMPAQLGRNTQAVAACAGSLPTSTGAAGVPETAATALKATTAAAAGPGGMSTTGSSGLLQQPGKKRPIPSSASASCHMQRPPRHMDMAAAAAAAAGSSDAFACASNSTAAAAGAEQQASQIERDTDEEGGSSKDDYGEEEEEDWQTLLWRALSAAAPPTRFACSGRLDSEPLPFLCPEVSVEGVGHLALPLCLQQAAVLKAVTEQAPHGKGLRTVVNTAVRDALQVDASQVHIGSSWQPVLQKAVAQISQQLGLSDSSTSTPIAAAVNIEARLYKLLLYEQGGHFSAHQDTEKERGMIGTLVVQLPCAGGHTGGALTVRHKGKRHTHDFSQGSERTLQYAAFFADCEHELSPISSGMRLVLVYNLVWVGQPGQAPKLHRESPAEVQLARALNAWEADLAEGSTQQRMLLLLEHQYTEANLSFEHLKGNDRAMARALSTCPGIDAHLVLVTRTVSGGAEWEGDCGYKRRRWGFDCAGYSDSDEEPGRRHTMTEVYDQNTKTSLWVAADGSKLNFGDIDDGDFYDPSDPEDGQLFETDDEPDDENYEGYTGNAGPTVEHIYRRALLVMWPRSQSLAYAQRVGLPAMLSVLQRRISDAEAQLAFSSNSSSTEGSLQQQQTGSSSSKACRRVAKHVLAALEACVTMQEQQQAQGIFQQPLLAGLLPPGAAIRNVRYFQPGPVFGGLGAAASIGTSQGISTVMQHSTRAVKQGVEGAAGVLLRLIALVANSPTGLSGDLPEQLAAAASVLDPAAVGPLLQQLVSRTVHTSSSGCVSLIMRLEGVPDLQQLAASAVVAAAGTAPDGVGLLVSLAVSAPGVPGLQYQVLQLLLLAMQNDTSGATAVRVASLLQQVRDIPQLRQPLANAAVSSLAAAGSEQHISSMLLILMGSQPHDVELQQQLVEFVCTALQSPSVVVYQASSIAEALPALQAHPALQQQLQCAAANAVCTNSALLSAQSDASMLALSQLLLQDAQLQAAQFGTFAAAAAVRPAGLLALLLQSEEVAASAVAQEQLVTAATLAIGTRQGVCQVSGEAQLLAALDGTPALRKRVELAVAECMFTQTPLLSAQTEASMLQLSDMLLGNPQLRGAYYGHFAAAVAQRQDSYTLLKQLLQSEAVTTALAVPKVQQLVSCQVANLQRLSAVPAFTWHMPQAVVPGGVVNSQQVQQFLRGPSTSFILRGFSGIVEARKAADYLLGRRSYCYGANASPTTYSATALAAGSARNAFVNISKTRAWFDSQAAGKEVYRKELQAVLLLRR